ncbi:MAG: MFS transporter [Pseudomonadota bacterium]|nr:MAG: MFS transporter [Pseudomonadota bacterium]
MTVPAFRLSALYGAYFAFIGAYMPYFGLYLAALGLAPWAIGVLLSVGQFTRIFAPNIWAWLADRRGRSIELLRLALAMAVVSYLGLFFAEGFVALFLVLAIHAFFVSASMPLFEAMTLRYLHGQYGRYGPIRLWGSVGFIVAVTVIGRALDYVDTRNFLWMALLPLVGALLASCVIAQPPAHADAADERNGSIRELALRAEVMALFGAGFLMCVAHGPLYGFYSIYLDDTGYSKTAVGLLWALGVVAEIVVFLAMPRWLTRFSPYRVLLASFALATVRFLLIGWCVESVPLLFVAQLMHAASFGSFHAAALTLVNAWFSGRRHVRGQALFSSLTYGAGSAVGAAGAGALWQSVGPVWTYTAASLAAACGLLLIAWRGRLFPQLAQRHA